MKPFVLVAAGLLASLVGAALTHAFDGFGGGGGFGAFGPPSFRGYSLYRGGLFGYRSSGSLYGLGYVPVPPYYALHPPVYYSQPVPRPYGDSPYAYPPLRPTVEARPRVYVNPFAPSAAPTGAPAAEAEPTIAQARIKVNPYYEEASVEPRQELAAAPTEATP